MMRCSMWTAAAAAGLTMMLSGGVVQGGEKDLPNCPVMGEPINLAISTPTEDGPVYFCCEGCIKPYNKKPAKFASAVAEQRKALSKREKVQVNCPVMGEPVDTKVYTEVNGEKVYFCCKGCIKKYTSEPGKYKSMLANSYTYQTQCPVTGEAIDPDVSQKLPGGETIYYCCEKCNGKVMSQPEKFAARLAEQGITINLEKIKEANEHQGHDHGDGDGHGHGHGDGHGH